MTDADEISTTRTTPWWMPDFAGSVVGLICAVLSVTPSLLPRPAILQGALAAFSFAIGYLLGAMLWAAIRRLLRRGPAPRIRRRWWIAYAAAWVVVIGVLSLVAVAWQNEVRTLVSMPPLGGSDIVSFLLAFVPLAILLLLAGKGSRVLFSRLRRRLGAVFAASISVVVVAGALAGILFAAVASVDRIYFDRNQFADASVSEPESDFRSAGDASAIAWDSLGRHGAAFVGGGPRADEISTLTNGRALEPIRVYAGMASAPTIQERAELVVSELERTGAFEREFLMLATTTGSGWLEPQTMDAFEYLHRGDTAIAAMQYAYTPSWVSFVFDPDAPVEAARVLFEAVEARWSELPVEDRPELITYGLSLGAHGSQAVFSDIDDLRTRTDGALFVGSPNGSALWQSLQNDRDAGSPAWQPVLNEGREVRWISRAGDDGLLSGPWDRPRVLYLQHATDPVTWLSPELLWRAPEWLDADQRSPDISPAMRWIPVVTGLQVVVDMLMGEAVPASYGHNYGDVVVTAWQQVTWSSPAAAPVDRIQAEIETYATIIRADHRSESNHALPCRITTTWDMIRHHRA